MSPCGTSLPISNSILAKLPSELLAHLMSKFTEVEPRRRDSAVAETVARVFAATHGVPWDQVEVISA